MKSGINFLLGAMLLLSVVACKDDDDVDPATLPGTWAMTDIHTENGTVTYEFLGTPLTSDFEFHGIDYDATITFTENPNVFVGTGTYTFAINTEILGQPYADTLTVDAFEDSGSWLLSGNTLSQIFAGDTSEFDILEFTPTKLRLKQELNAPFTEQGITFTPSATVYTTLEKQ